jgi:Mat/Ecp fimbriae major subunit
MKIQMLKAALLSTAIAALGFTATTAQAATATATAKAKILRQVTVTKTADLDYGIIVSGPASTVAVSTAGARTCGVGLVCSGTTTAAAFTIGGTTGSVVTSTLVSSAATATMVANAGAFTVGGILTVGLNQADGDYTGSFNATVDYQ